MFLITGPIVKLCFENFFAVPGATLNSQGTKSALSVGFLTTGGILILQRTGSSDAEILMQPHFFRTNLFKVEVMLVSLCQMCNFTCSLAAYLCYAKWSFSLTETKLGHKIPEYSDTLCMFRGCFTT